MYTPSQRLHCVDRSYSNHTNRELNTGRSVVTENDTIRLQLFHNIIIEVLAVRSLLQSSILRVPIRNKLVSYSF